MPPASPKKRILVADDEPGITHLLKLLFEANGAYEVRAEHSGLLALAAAREFEPDLILMDVMMPGMSGVEVAAALSKDPRLKSIPVIFLTGTIQSDAPEAPPNRLRGYPCLVKPLNASEVLAAIERTLCQESEGPATPSP